MGAKSNLPPQPPSLHQWATCLLHAYSYIQQSGRSVKSVNAKNTKKSLIHENADANITCDFGDISRSRSRLPHTHTARRPATSLARLQLDEGFFKSINYGISKCRHYPGEYLAYGFIPAPHREYIPMHLICTQTFSNEGMKPSGCVSTSNTNMPTFCYCRCCRLLVVEISARICFWIWRALCIFRFPGYSRGMRRERWSIIPPHSIERNPIKMFLFVRWHTTATSSLECMERGWRIFYSSPIGALYLNCK